MLTWQIVYCAKTGSPSQNVKVIKKLLKNVTLQILNFIPVNKLIKSFPMWCNVSFFIAVFYWKKRHKINIAPHRENLHYLTYRDTI